MIYDLAFFDKNKEGMNNSSNSKVIVIGLDGADWRLIKPLIDAGRMPTLDRLIREGSSGLLRSTIRPESSVAWSSFGTGVWPGEHGIFSFLRHEEGSYSFKLANASNIGMPEFWKYLGEAGFKVGLVNVPFTYPPQPVNGFTVSGMLTPGTDASFTYPIELQDRILSLFQNYQLDAADKLNDRDTLVENSFAYTQQQVELSSYLMNEQEWDLFMVVFTALDRLQHYFWRDMDPQHPAHNPDSAIRFGHVIERHLTTLDAAIEKLLSAAPDDALIMIMSDHGFNGCANRFFVNEWLEMNGYLKTKKNNNRRARVADKLSALKAVPLVRKVKNAFFPADWGPENLRISQFAHTVDWKRTKAYFAPDGGIRINLKGREPDGITEPGQEFESIKEELKQKLLAFVPNQERPKPLAHVYFSDVLYQGRYAHKAPDLILEPQRESSQAADNYILDGSINKGEGILSSSLPYSGNHALQGILITSGPGINKATKISDATIVDLAPTIMAYLNVPIPAHMEGKALSSAFYPGLLSESKSTETTIDIELNDKSGEFEEQEENIIEARLRNLGYLD